MEKRLIAEIKKYPALYDRRCAEYRSRKERILAWHCVSESLGIKEIRCQARWKSLRDRFMREYASMQQASGSEVDASESQWEHYEDILFLKDQVKPRKNVTYDFENEDIDYLKDPVEPREKHTSDFENEDMGFFKAQVKPKKNRTSDFENGLRSSSQESMILLPEYTEQSILPTTHDNDFSTFLENLTQIAEKRFCSPPEPKNNEHDAFFGMVKDLFAKLPAEEVEDQKIAFINCLHSKIKSYRIKY